MQKIEVLIQPGCVGGVSEALRKAKIGPFRASAVTIFDPQRPPTARIEARGTRSDASA